MDAGHGNPTGVLLREMDVDEADVQRRWELVQFRSADVERIRTVAALIRQSADELTDGFFKYLARFPEAETLLGAAPLVEEARRLKSAHLKAMVEGPYDLTYAQQRVELALIYTEADLDHEVFLGAFHHLISQIGNAIMGRPDRPRQESFDTFLAIQKVAFFDIALIGDIITFERQRVIRQQQRIIRALSTPVLKVRDRLLLVPLVGIVDAPRARRLTEDLLHAIPEHRAKVVVIDITGTAVMDTAIANSLVATINTARLMGADVIVTGVSTVIAQALVQLGLDLTRLHTVGDLEGGIARAETMLGAPAPR